MKPAWCTIFSQCISSILFITSTCFGPLQVHHQEEQLYLCDTWHLCEHKCQMSHKYSCKWTNLVHQLGFIYKGIHHFEITDFIYRFILTALQIASVERRRPISALPIYNRTMKTDFYHGLALRFCPHRDTCKNQSYFYCCYYVKIATNIEKLSRIQTEL